MRAFILFDLASNAEVHAAIIASETMLDVAPEGRVWVEVPMPLEDHTVAMIDGQPSVVTRAAQPDREITRAKSNRRQYVNQCRAIAEYGLFAWEGSLFDSDRDSQARLQGAFQLANLALTSGQQYQVSWMLADNTARTLSAVDMLGVGHALAEHILATHMKARDLKAQIDAATTIAEIEAVDW